MFKLVRYFSITSFIAFIVVTTMLFLFYRESALNDLIALREENNVALTQSFANSLWSEFAPFISSASDLSVDEIQNHPETARLREAVLAQLNGLSVIKVKVYDLNALTVFSTEPAQIGQDKSGNEGYLTAQAGRVATELTHRDTFSAFEQTIENRDVISSYVPIQPTGIGGEIEGVIEIYDDVTLLLQRIEQTQKNVVIGVVGILVILYIVLFVIVRQGERIIQQQRIEREQAEIKQRESEQRLSTIVGSAPIMLWATDTQGVLTLLEGKALDIWGIKQDATIGKSTSDVFQKIPQLIDDMQQALSGKEVISTITLNEFTFDTRYTIARDKNGGILSIIGVATDITERMMAEEALIEASENLEQRNQQLERVHEFMRATLEQINDLVLRGASQGELGNHLQQVQEQFIKLE